MKLNLLPTYVSRGRQVKVAILISFLIAAASIGASVFMIVDSKKKVDLVKQQAQQWRASAELTVSTAAKAEAIMANPDLARVIRQVNLAKAMDAHNKIYPEFYLKVFPYIPSFFRINNMTVNPNSPDQVTLNLTGVIRNEFQYNDLVLALLRIPGATTVNRSGFSKQYPTLGPLNDQDQVGRMTQPGQPAPLPEDPLARVNTLISRGGVSGFEGAGGFGSGNPNTGRGAMPGATQINVSVVMPGNVFTPNPRATLSAG